MLLMKGAFVLLKIWCGAEVSEVGCVQLWFSIAITNTVLIGSAFASQQQTSALTKAHGQTRNKQRESIHSPVFWISRRRIDGGAIQICDGGIYNITNVYFRGRTETTAECAELDVKRVVAKLLLRRRIGRAEQLLLDELAVVPCLGIAAVKQYDRALWRPSAQCGALSFDLVQLGNRSLIMQDDDLAGRSVFFVSMRPTAAWQSSFWFRECDGLGFGHCEVSSRCNKAEQRQYRCSNTAHAHSGRIPMDVAETIGRNRECGNQRLLRSEPVFNARITSHPIKCIR